MPIYEYKCSGCGHEFEVIQKITEGPRRKCEKCGKLKAKRQISQTSFILKGSGWYATDYGRGTKDQPAADKVKDSSDKPQKESPSSSTSGSEPADKAAHA